MSEAKITDVAREAGVSAKTVSRVINKEATVKAATRERVEAVIAELGYKPNIAARNLRGSQSWALGFVYYNPNAYYVIDAQNGALASCGETGYGLQILPFGDPSDDAADELIDQVQRARLAGLILLPPMSENPAIIKKLRENDITYVRVVGGLVHGDDAERTIQVDDQAAAHSIARYMTDLGHRKIVFLSGEEIHHSTGERRKGFLAALGEAGIDTSPDLEVAGAYSFNSGFQRANQLLDEGRDFTALFCCNDEIAAGALAALTSRGKRVPEDISVTGFEDSPFAHILTPHLTTARQSISDIAAEATRLLIQELRPQMIRNDEDAQPAGMDGNVYTPALVVRGSTGSPA